MKLNMTWLSACVALILSGCGGQDNVGTANLSGQVSTVNTSSSVGHYAASRFLEHAAMGASPASVAQLRLQGIEGWINGQMKMAPTKIVTPESMINFDDQRDKPAYERMRDFYNLNLFNALIGA